ncbi:MAG: hypothetical protein ACLQPD_26555 [Desulfomonilaceae bacterium]
MEEIVQELVPWTKLFFAIQIPLWVILIIILLIFIVSFIFKYRLAAYFSQLAKNRADLKTIVAKARLAEREKIRLQNETDAYKKILNATLAMDKILSDFHVMMRMASSCGDSVEERGRFFLQLDREVIGKWAAEVSQGFGLLHDRELSVMIQTMEVIAKQVISICNPIDDLLQENVPDKDREAAAVKKLEEHFAARKEWRTIVHCVLEYTNRKLTE